MEFKSTVTDLISFKPLENPPWTKLGETLSYDQMLQEIIDYRKQWRCLTVDADHMKVIQKRFQAEFCITNTDPPRDETKRETKNLMDVLRYFQNMITKEEEQQQRLGESGSDQPGGRGDIEDIECIGLLEKSMLQEAHCLAVEGVATKKGRTKPGVFSNKPRLTTYKGKVYWYQQPEDMTVAVDLILDRMNSLVTDLNQKKNDKDKIEGIFKSVAWLVFELLDLHPFGNGNGRLCRVLCSYILSSLTSTPFPSPLYFPCNENVEDDHSQCPQPCKDAYEQALVDARESKTRHPCKLLTMIVECNWKMWKEFMKQIKGSKN